jgi:hypothetical protein
MLALCDLFKGYSVHVITQVVSLRHEFHAFNATMTNNDRESFSKYFTMTEIEKNEVKWTPTDTDALLDVDALQRFYAQKGERGVAPWGLFLRWVWGGGRSGTCRFVMAAGGVAVAA